MIGSEFLQYIFSNRSKDSNIFYDLLLLVVIIHILVLVKYLQDNIPKYINKLYSKFSERYVINYIGYDRIDFYEISERNNPINVALEYLARTGRRYFPRQFLFLETNFNKIDKIFNSIRRRIYSEENRRWIDSFIRGIALEESRRRIDSEERRYIRGNILTKLMSLPILLPDFVDEEIEIPEDAICGITFERPNCRTSCGHYFCHDAITTWLKQQQNEGRKITCPSCRSIITKVSIAQEN